jgi:hypothetical protein
MIAVALFVTLILLALVITIVGTVAWIVLSARPSRSRIRSRTWPRLANVAIFAVPIVALLLGARLSRKHRRRDFLRAANDQPTHRRPLPHRAGRTADALGEVIARPSRSTRTAP